MDKQQIKQYRQDFLKVSKPSTSSEWETYNRLLPIISELDNLEEIEKRIKESTQMTETETDTEMLNMARDDLNQLESQRKAIQYKVDQLCTAKTPSNDSTDTNNAILEIRAGAGGDEASLFARDLFRMYLQYADSKQFKVEIINRRFTSSSGIKEATAKIIGPGAFGKLKNESGVHRVQRIPVTESSGRIHTSTASVAVLPEAKEIDMNISKQDIKIEVFRSSGPGGQSVNKTDSAVRMTHLPTGVVVSCQEGKSQLRNKETAMVVLRSRIFEKQRQDQAEKEGKLRKDQIGRAMRSEKIRTYNIPQSRVTDHRIKKSWHNIEDILNGDLDKIITSLAKPTP